MTATPMIFKRLDPNTRTESKYELLELINMVAGGMCGLFRCVPKKEGEIEIYYLTCCVTLDFASMRADWIKSMPLNCKEEPDLESVLYKFRAVALDKFIGEVERNRIIDSFDNCLFSCEELATYLEDRGYTQDLDYRLPLDIGIRDLISKEELDEMIRHVKYRDIDVSEYEARSEVINRFLDTHALEVMGRFYL